MAYKIVHLPERCVGCKKCVKACAKAHGGVANCEIFEVKGTFVFFHCMHCGNPKCAEACPVGAIQKIEGKILGYVFRTPIKEQSIVAFFSERCVGCKNCMEACVFGAIKENPYLGIINKCDLCYERVVQKKEQPYCVEACPNEALQVKYSTLEEMAK
jgi:Fe-S-cluster-containing dehydrogenase component